MCLSLEGEVDLVSFILLKRFEKRIKDKDVHDLGLF